jgi:hypothetical protein
MKAALRLGIAYVVAALALAPAAALAQAVPQSTTNTPAADAVGPKELQNFSISGTVTRQSEQPAQVPSATSRSARNQAQPPSVAAQPTASAPARVESGNAAPDRQRSPQRAPADAGKRSAAQPPIQQREADATSPNASLPTLNVRTNGSLVAPAPATADPGFASESAATTPTLAPEHSFSFIPWLLALIALCAGGAFLFWRSRPREAFAGGPQVDVFVAPEPKPMPRAALAPAGARVPAPAPAPPKPASPPSIAGVVSTRLRPWVEIGFNPLRCIVDDDKAAIEFELELFNSGSAPARAVLVEAGLFNAGPVQDQEIGRFFAQPVGQGERIVSIPPLKRVAIRNQVAIGREQVQVYELGGRRAIVPLIAFNALYSWSGGEGQTSVGYLLGVETKGDKLAPFGLDRGPRIFRAVAARLLPESVRA